MKEQVFQKLKSAITSRIGRIESMCVEIAHKLSEVIENTTDEEFFWAGDAFTMIIKNGKDKMYAEIMERTSYVYVTFENSKGNFSWHGDFDKFVNNFVTTFKLWEKAICQK